MNELNINEIMEYLPHRYPFLLIDRVTSYESGKTLTAIKNVTYNENFFQGHFPQWPVMPGVLILEAIAQATGILAFKSINEQPKQGSLYFLVSIDKARFRKTVEPGDQLVIDVNTLKSKRNMWKFKGVAKVEGVVVASAEIMCAEKQL